MDNQHLFELINAAPGLGPVRLVLTTVMAQWLIWLVPIAMTFAWVRGDIVARAELLHMLLATLIALGVAQIVVHVWPQPRPFALHLGTQYLPHSTDPGLPSDHVTVFWSLALGALASRRYAVWGFPLLAIGLLAGWARVYLGVHFPFDVLAAFPVALTGVVIARALRGPLSPVAARVLELYDRCIGRLRSHGAAHNA